MTQSTTTDSLALVQHSSAHASLAALGVHQRRLDLFGPIRHQAHIPQKTVRFTPSDKLYDAFIALLAGAQGLVEINGRLRPDPALQAAFGRCGCAEQSVVQDTLDACTEETVEQLEAAWALISRQHSQGYRHPYQTDWRVWDVDMTGMPCGKKAAMATTGYFAKQRNRRGRQLGRVLATRYREIVVDRLFDGKTQLNVALLPLVSAAEVTLDLDAAKRERTLVRVDAGAGSISDINWLLMRGYFVVSKDYSTARARRLAQQVTDWLPDPRDAQRHVGLIPGPASDYYAGQYWRSITRVAVRCRLANGQWGVGVVISSLPLADACTLAGLDATAAATDPTLALLAYVYLYDQRGGGVETAFKEDKQGLGITTRSKKRFAAQQVVALLGALAHNVVTWAKRWVLAMAPAIQRLGIKCLVRDVFGITGWVALDQEGHVRQIVLTQANRLTHHVLVALQALVSSADVTVRLGET
jgi:hypothetical protein